jgi:hypothetical protein
MNQEVTVLTSFDKFDKPDDMTDSNLPLRRAHDTATASTRDNAGSYWQH